MAPVANHQRQQFAVLIAFVLVVAALIPDGAANGKTYHGVDHGVVGGEVGQIADNTYSMTR